MSLPLLPLLLLYLLHTSAAVKPKNGLHKCCLLNQQYVLDGDNNLQCVNLDSDTPPTDWWWIPKHVMAAANVSKKSNEQKLLNLIATLGNHNLFYGSKPSCKNHSKDILFNIIKKQKHEFDLVIQQNEIKLKVLKSASFLGANAVHRTMFQSGSFCIDKGPDMFVVVLCPCLNNYLKCVRKCCAEDQTFNMTESECEDSATAPDLLPGILRADANNNDFYRLVNAKKKLNCVETTVHVIKDVRSKFFLLDDGSIQALDTERIFTPNDYCVDHTSSQQHEELVHFCHHTDDLYYMFGFVFKSFAVICLVISVVVLIGAHVRYIYDTCCNF